MSNPLLNLDTLITRPKIAIDDKEYEILSPDELSILDSQRFTQWGAALEELGKDPEKEDELKALVDEAAAKVMVGVPKKVFRKLKDGQKMTVLEVFTALLLRRKLGMAGAVLKGAAAEMGAGKTGGRPTGEK